MSFRSTLDTLFATGDLDGVLRKVESLVERVFCEPLNTAEIFSSAYLDEICQRVGRRRLDEMRPRHIAQAQAVSAVPAHPPVVFIASRLQASGGHTALLADIARLLGRPSRVLLTGVGGATDLRSIQHRFAGVQDLHFEKAPAGQRLRKLDWLQQRLREISPAEVWLFNHHQDSVAVAAVQADAGYALKYVHHGDHHLCLGVTLAFGEHYDPHPMGFRNCRDVLRRADNKYLPMASPDPLEGMRLERSSTTGPLVTCTAAGANKIEQAYWPAYAEVIADVLSKTGGVHIHLGALSWRYRWRIRRNLRRNGVAPSAFRYLGRVRSVAHALLREKVDLYIASFPYPGARSLVEVMAAGVPVAAHDHCAHVFLSAMDMLPAGSCFWSRPGQLLDFIAAHDRGALQELGREARLHYEKFHTYAVMHDSLAGDPQAQEIPKTDFKHRPDPLTQALLRARALTMAGVLSRWMLRTARRLRSAAS